MGMSKTSRTTPLAFSAATASGESFPRTFRLKLSSVFESGQIYPQSISSQLEIRCYWNSTAHNAVTGSPSDITLTSCNLLVEESHLDLATTRKKLALYAFPQGDIRTSVYTFNSVTTGKSYSQVLQSHVGYNSAYLIYFRSTSKAGAAEYTLLSPTDISIVDDANNRQTSLDSRQPKILGSRWYRSASH